MSLPTVEGSEDTPIGTRALNGRRSVVGRPARGRTAGGGGRASTDHAAHRVNAAVELAKYSRDRHPRDRAASLDHCQAYFRTALAGDPAGIDVPQACLHLGFYLASWGMYRGSGSLYRFSSTALSDVVGVVMGPESDSIRGMDVEKYDSDAIHELLHFAGTLRGAFPDGRASDTLVTKTMLGVFGVTPAFDGFFRKGFGRHRFDEVSLWGIKSYFDAHRDVIEAHRRHLLLANGGRSEIRDTQARVIDSIFYAAGGGPIHWRS